jgi:DNA-directed RNA polymerase subunit H (RpoH/RPB5)
MQKSKETVLEMFQQRGYKLIDDDDTQILAEKEDGNQICAFFDIIKYNGDKAREIIATINSIGILHAVVIYKDTYTSAAKNINNILSNIEIELFCEKELQYNITKHRLQPVFELLSKEKGDEIKKKYGTKFPTLQITDPISRFYNYKKGDVIKVTEKNKYIKYLIVRG